MADLPLLQSGRVEFAGVPAAVTPQVSFPTVDYVGTRAAVSYQQTVAQTLDRLSNQLFGIARTAAQEAGYQYVADNPVTTEQLEAAKQGNTTPLGIGRGGSVYDQAVRKARAFELSSTFEAEARTRLTGMLQAAEEGKVTSEQISTAIGSLMNGYSKSLAQVDPEASLKFRASIATTGNTVLAKAAENELKRVKAQRLVNFDRDFDNSTRLLEAAVSQGYWMDPTTGGKRSVDELADVYRQSINTSALLLGDINLQRQYSDRFEKMFREAKIGAVTRFLVTDEARLSDPETTLRQINAGNVGKMSDVVKQMLATDFDSVAKVQANFMTAVNNRNTLQQRARDDVKRKGDADAINLLEQIFPLAETDPKRKALVQQLTQLPEGSVPIGVLKDVLEPNKEGNAAVEFNLLQGIYSGTVTEPAQIWGAVGRGLTGKQAVSLLKTLTTEDRRDVRELDNGLARLAGIPTMPGQITVIDPKGVEFQRLQGLRADAQQIQAQATREGKILQPRQVLSEVEKNLESRRNSEAAKAARTQLEVYEKKAGGPITSDSLPALERKGTFKPNELTRIRQLLNQSQGMQ
jgi:hypothetical protein